MQEISDIHNYGGEEEPFDFQTNMFTYEVSQDVVSQYHVDAVQGMHHAEPLITHDDYFLTTPGVTLQQCQNDFLTIQSYPTPYVMPDIQFLEPGQGVKNDNNLYDGPSTQDVPQSIVAAAPPSNGSLPRTEIPKDKQSSDQIALSTVIKPTTRSVQCFNCKVTRTPLWRRTPDRENLLCNACGLYYKQTGRDRSTSRNRQQRAKMIQQGSASPEKEPLRCVNCNRTETPLWRKNSRGETICNACGLYARMHKKDRPAEMHKAEIQRRKPSSYYGFDDDSEAAIAVEKAVSSGLDHDPEYISEVRNMGTKDAVRDALALAERRCRFLQAVLFQMENNNHSPDEQCN